MHLSLNRRRYRLTYIIAVPFSSRVFPYILLPFPRLNHSLQQKKNKKKRGKSEENNRRSQLPPFSQKSLKSEKQKSTSQNPPPFTPKVLFQRLNKETIGFYESKVHIEIRPRC